VSTPTPPSRTAAKGFAEPLTPTSSPASPPVEGSAEAATPAPPPPADAQTAAVRVEKPVEPVTPGICVASAQAEDGELLLDTRIHIHR